MNVHGEAKDFDSINATTACIPEGFAFLNYLRRDWERSTGCLIISQAFEQNSTAYRPGSQRMYAIKDPM